MSLGIADKIEQTPRCQCKQKKEEPSGSKSENTQKKILKENIEYILKQLFNLNIFIFH